MRYLLRQDNITMHGFDHEPYFLYPPRLVVPWSGETEADDDLWLSLQVPHSTMSGRPVSKEPMSSPHLTRLILLPWRLTYVIVEARSNILSFRQAGYAGSCRGLSLRCDSAAQWEA